jgi:hypothetical protein
MAKVANFCNTSNHFREEIGIIIVGVARNYHKNSYLCKLIT